MRARQPPLQRWMCDIIGYGIRHPGSLRPPRESDAHIRSSLILGERTGEKRGGVLSHELRHARRFQHQVQRRLESSSTLSTRTPSTSAAASVRSSSSTDGCMACGFR